MLDRRALLQTLAAMGAVSTEAFASTTSGGPYNKTPKDGLLLWAKLNADLSGKTVYSFTAGTVWGFLPQGDDVTLADFAKRAYGYQSLIARKAHLTPDGNVVIKQQGWTYYLDPDTYIPTRELRNVYTGKIDKATYPNAGASEQTYTPEGPKALQGQYPLPSGQGERPYDLRVRVIGDHAFIDEVSFARFQSGGISWYKLEGNLWSYACRPADLTNSKLTHIPNTWSQNLVAEWQTWTGMHGMPGHILFKGQGAHIKPDQVPKEFMAALDEYSPGQFEAAQHWDV